MIKILLTSLQIATGFRAGANGARAWLYHNGDCMMADGTGDEYVYDEASGEWISAAEANAKSEQDGAVEVRDAVGNILADGDQVTLIKDLTVKGAGQTLKRGTLIKSIRLTGDAQEIDCRFDGIKGLVLRAEFVRKR
jgi:protein PhnA